MNRSVIAQWLGHEPVATPYVYSHAHLKLEEQAMAETTSSKVPLG